MKNRIFSLSGLALLVLSIASQAYLIYAVSYEPMAEMEVISSNLGMGGHWMQKILVGLLQIIEFNF